MSGKKKKPTELTFDTGKVLVGSCLDRLKELDDASIDSIVSDPPYELGFMGKQWDASGIAYNVDLWRECLRVLKPGGHLLAFGGTRTYHRMAVAIEDAGFEVRDSIHWLYGSGFPKSHNVAIGIDKQAGVMEHRGKAHYAYAHGTDFQGRDMEAPKTMPPHEGITDEAKQWKGWGTALKPAHEPIVVARKPLDGTVAANVQEHGTGALNIDGCRVGSETLPAQARGVSRIGTFEGADGNITPERNGRWPANIVFTHAAECQQTGISDDTFGGGAKASGGFVDGYESGDGFVGQSVEVPVWACVPGCPVAELDEQSGGASRFFTVTEWSDLDVPFRYVAKPGKKERNAGLDGLPVVKTGAMAGNLVPGQPLAGNGTPIETPERQNFHPTVKPVALMRWLVRLATQPNGIVLDPFLGSGTTAVAAVLEGFQWVGCEMTEDYLPIIEGRVNWAESQPQTLFEGDAA